MKRFLFLAVLFLGIVFTPKAAFSNHYYPPYYFHGHSHGVHFGHGYFNFGWWPGFAYTNPYNLGFSYWPYNGYQPYYASFAAISYSPSTDKGGYAWGYSSLGAAVEASRNFCAAADCKPVVWVQGGCASMAVNKETQALGWGYASSRYQAEANAKKACRKSSPAGLCEVKAYVCTY